jgi:uncharacterized CHY-type Zn-finger protein
MTREEELEEEILRMIVDKKIKYYSQVYLRKIYHLPVIQFYFLKAELKGIQEAKQEILNIIKETNEGLDENWINKETLKQKIILQSADKPINPDRKGENISDKVICSGSKSEVKTADKFSNKGCTDCHQRASPPNGRLNSDDTHNQDDCIMLCGECGKECHFDDDGLCPKCQGEWQRKIKGEK